MDKINLPFFYNLGSHLNPLTTARPTAETRLVTFFQAMQVKSDVEYLLASFESLNVCRVSAQELTKAIGAVEAWSRGVPPADWGEQNIQVDMMFTQVVLSAATFQTVLSAELQTLATYQATQKGIYSTTDLIEHAERTLPDSAQAKIEPEVIQEIQQSGRCLAFDNATD